MCALSRLCFNSGPPAHSAAMQSHYDVLKIALDAPIEVVRAAYRVFAARHHPDRAGADELALMQRVNEAYRVLSDPALRKAHDAWIRAHRRRRAADAPREAGARSDDPTHAASTRAASTRPTAADVPPVLRALPDAAVLAQRAQRRRIAAAYAAHAPRLR
jgi:curved DNA-binding protein CbpA